MIGAAAAYMSGLFFASFCTEGSDLLLLAGLLPALFIAAKPLKIHTSDIIMLAVFFFDAGAVGVKYNNCVYGKITSYSGTEGSFIGEVDDVGYYDNDKALYTLDGSINGVQNAKIVFFGDSCDVSVGDVVTLESCTFSIPDSDFLFDSEGYYKSRGIFLTAENISGFSVEHTDSHRLRRLISSYREKVIWEFRVKMGNTDGSFLASIVFGEKSGLDTDEKSIMYRCGIGHIMAVSGLHVSIAAALLMLLLKKLRIGKLASFAALNVFLGLMIIMVKFPVSAVRAAIMLDFMYSARLFRRQNDTFNFLSGAVLIICLMNPYAVQDSGFLLSAAGTFGVGVFAPFMTSGMKTENIFQRLVKSMAAMLCVTLMVMPLSILYFDETSAISPITNIVLVPLTVAAMIIGFIYVITGGIVSLLSVAEILTDAVLAAADKLGRIQFTHFSCGNKKLFFISLICAAFVIFAAAVIKNKRYISLAVAGALTVFVFSSAVMGKIEQNKYLRLPFWDEAQMRQL